MNMLHVEAPSRRNPLAARPSPCDSPLAQDSVTPFAAYLGSAASRVASVSDLPNGVCAPGKAVGVEATAKTQGPQEADPNSFADPSNTDDEELGKVFQKFVGRTFFGLMLKEMRKSIHKTPYFHGGLAEEIFEQHLDATLAEKLAESSGEQFSKPMYELFQLQRRQ